MSEYAQALESTLAGSPVDTKHQNAIILPDGYHVEDLEEFKESPRRVSGRIELIEASSFVKYVKRYASESTIIKADVNRERFVSVFDYHKDADSAGWEGHIATYDCPVSEQWKRWTGKNGEKMTQQSFAEFIEANQLDIQTYKDEGPSSLQMLEVSRNLQANKKVQFKSSIDLSNGDVGFEYQATTEGVSGSAKGKIDVPKEFFIIIPVYEGDAAYPIKARLRYRISDGVLALWYELVEPKDVQRDAFKTTLETIEKEIPANVEIYRARA
ncbi:hypothetical protein LMG33818_000008 [Halomonadaceae bacterium LMG 33818]|uniref:DUF2303 family protein n=1 Tax=Cernens ardua TaxID=3402176 RepID=UPI003EDC8A6F